VIVVVIVVHDDDLDHDCGLFVQNARVRHAVILAGGSGTRLWPLSRRARPKQLVPLGPAGESLLELAIRRACAVTDRVWIVTAAQLVEATREVIARVGSPVEVLAEPVGRNTAAAIGLAAAHIERADPAGVIVVLPADQVIADEPAFAAIAHTALEAVERDPGAIGTIGIVPTRAETGFGYLEIPAGAVAGAVVAVRRFVEKPDAATAARYVAAGTYLWNAGMFFASAHRLLAELAAHLPDTRAALAAIVDDPATLAERYPRLASISIDYAVMEKAANVVTIPAAIGWDDVGSWAALATPDDDDPEANRIIGRALAVDAAGTYVRNDDPDLLVVAVGVRDLVVVKSGNAVLVIPRAAAQSVRHAIDAIETDESLARRFL
jgi:mannose-1-phosphate guanylyltransferase